VDITTNLGDGIYQIRLPMVGSPLRYINAYAVEEHDGLTLVDCGWKADDVLATLHAGLAEAGHTLADVRRLAITHHHFDHYGLAATLLRAGVPELLMHQVDWERVESFLMDPGGFDALADAWMTRNGFVPEDDPEDAAWHALGEPVKPTQLLAGGERIGRLEAVWTPGHSPGHLCFIDTKSKRLISGDHILDPITPHVGQWVEERGNPLGDYIASLERSLTHPEMGVLPAHGEPFPNLAKRAGEILAHTAHREQQVIDILARDGARSAGDVARTLTWTRRERSFDSLSEFHRQFAVSETLAHLAQLDAKGMVVRDAGAQPVTYVLGDPTCLSTTSASAASSSSAARS
jgi:glyoxylase-like metal-dependent hydrolase (beta-lactamase superfamily II)